MMIFTSIGDVAQRLTSQRLNTALQTDFARLSIELASGETTTPSRHLSGDYRYLSAVEHRKQTAQAHETAASEASGFVSAMQSALGRVQSSTQSLYADLLAAAKGPSQGRVVVAAEASQHLDSMLSALNSTFAGRSLFAGDATDGPAVISSEELLQQIRSHIASELTADGIVTAVADFFTAPDGFLTSAYLGAADHLSPFKLGEHETVQLYMRADSEEIRAALANTALAAISADYDAPDLQSALQDQAGLGLFTDQRMLTELRAGLGFAEARIEEIGVATASERTALEFARESLLGIDEYETATRLEQTQFQIEALYSVTARLSRLSLLGYL